MTIEKIREELSHHPIFAQGIAPLMNMGFPIIEKKGDTIVLAFLLHDETISEDEKIIRFYPTAYKVAFELPSLKLTEFKNLIVSNSTDMTQPAAEVDVEYMRTVGGEIIEELYRWFDATLEVLPVPEISDHAIESYQSIFKDAVEALGLNHLYYKITLL